jgi:hypothetical protein
VAWVGRGSNSATKREVNQLQHCTAFGAHHFHFQVSKFSGAHRSRGREGASVRSPRSVLAHVVRVRAVVSSSGKWFPLSAVHSHQLAVKWPPVGVSLTRVP